jgi:hypothetical protein
MIIASTRKVLRPDQKLVFAPLGDIHRNAPGHDRQRFNSAVEWIRRTSEREDRVVITPLMGDELETFSSSERQALRASGLHSSSRAIIENMLRNDLDEFCKTIEPIKHTLSSAISGNHNYTFQESASGSLVGKSVTQIIAERFNIPYLGICGVLIVELSPSDGSTSSHPFKVLMHHGFGTASSKGASINQMVKLKERFPMCNLYIMGHNHVKIATTTEGIDFRVNKRTGQWQMCDVVQAFVRSASFLKGYVEGEIVDNDTGSYVEQKCLVPAGLGIVTANLRWNEHTDQKGHKRYSGFSVHVQE